VKKIITPEPSYQSCTDANDIQSCLSKNHASEKRKGHNIRTLYGGFKFIRTMPTFSALGDFVILAQCVEWMNKNNQKINENEIARSLKYFEDYDSGKRKSNNALVEYLTALGRDMSNSIKMPLRKVPASFATN